ncbi:hypothetical protein B0H16DRAFT_1471521 [Mycena metata]|uniref:Uncharacterized protein n=1 Tax=Mycena metata TaxID=1033252 RepID=A0AAD7MNW9_9AGAR|nr:hypothetical protein B0H16DRAFT_1471521 [Mycena metata]
MACIRLPRTSSRRRYAITLNGVPSALSIPAAVLTHPTLDAVSPDENNTPTSASSSHHRKVPTWDALRRLHVSFAAGTRKEKSPGTYHHTARALVDNAAGADLHTLPFSPNSNLIAPYSQMGLWTTAVSISVAGIYGWYRLRVLYLTSAMPIYLSLAENPPSNDQERVSEEIAHSMRTGTYIDASIASPNNWVTYPKKIDRFMDKVLGAPSLLREIKLQAQGNQIPSNRLDAISYLKQKEKKTAHTITEDLCSNRTATPLSKPGVSVWVTRPQRSNSVGCHYRREAP